LPVTPGWRCGFRVERLSLDGFTEPARWLFQDETVRRWWLGHTIQQSRTCIGLEFASYFLAQLVDSLFEQRSLNTDDVHDHTGLLRVSTSD